MELVLVVFWGEWLYHPAEAFCLGVGDLFHGV